MEEMELITLVIDAAQVVLKAFELLKARAKKVKDEELERYMVHVEDLSRRLSSIANPQNHAEITGLTTLLFHILLREIRQIRFIKDPNIRGLKSQEILLNKVEDFVNIPTRSNWADQKYNGLLFDLVSGSWLHYSPRAIRLEDGRYHWMNIQQKQEVLDILSQSRISSCPYYT